MTQRTITHGTFTIERTYAAPRGRVFAAFSTLEGKAAWFTGDDSYSLLDRSMDFREGGKERLVGRWQNGITTRFEATYFDIVTEERIVYAYEMHLDDNKISVSLATIEFKAAGSGTRLILTEDGAFLDGYDDVGRREHGTNLLMDRMGESLAKALTSA